MVVEQATPSTPGRPRWWSSSRHERSECRRIETPASARRRPTRRLDRPLAPRLLRQSGQAVEVSVDQSLPFGPRPVLDALLHPERFGDRIEVGAVDEFDWKSSPRVRGALACVVLLNATIEIFECSPRSRNRRRIAGCTCTRACVHHSRVSATLRPRRPQAVSPRQSCPQMVSIHRHSLRSRRLLDHQKLLHPDAGRLLAGRVVGANEVRADVSRPHPDTPVRGSKSAMRQAISPAIAHAAIAIVACGPLRRPPGTTDPSTTRRPDTPSAPPR